MTAASVANMGTAHASSPPVLSSPGSSSLGSSSSARGPLRAAILDWAGTAIDFGSRAPVAALLGLFADHGIPLDEAQARGPMGLHKRDHIRLLCQLPSVSAVFQARSGRPASEADIDGLYQALLPRTLQAAKETTVLIPGLLALVAELRRRGMRIGSTTGYNAQMMAEIAPLAAAQGYAPDSIMTVSDVPAGRPAPWMCFRTAERFGIYPLSACVKIGDTVTDIEEGKNAGMWTIALARCGNEVGLSEADLHALPAAEQAARIATARQRLLAAQPHFVVDGPADVIPLLDAIDGRLARGERP